MKLQTQNKIKSNQLIIKLNEKLSNNQIEFVKNSCLDSYPNHKIFIKQNAALIKNPNRDKKEIINSIKKLIFISKRIGENKIIFNQIRKIKFNKDPLKYLEKNDEIKRISNDLFQFQGSFLKNFRIINEYFFKLAVNKYNAVDQENPILWPIDLYKKIDYLSEFPQQSLFVVGLKKNNKNLDSFSKKYSSKNNFKEIEIDNHLEKARYGLQPAVCDNCYYALSNLSLLKNTVYTTYNKVFRNENSKNNSLDRLISFSVRDVMFVGDKKFVISTRNKLIKDLKKFLKKTELDCSIETANDPFFIGNIDKKLFQNAFELKYEILAMIPFLKKKIAIGSINFHVDTFGKAFNIKNNKKNIFSGCIGIGFERILLALYSQHGNKIENWPKSIKQLLKIK